LAYQLFDSSRLLSQSELGTHEKTHPTDRVCAVPGIAKNPYARSGSSPNAGPVRPNPLPAIPIDVFAVAGILLSRVLRRHEVFVVPQGIRRIYTGRHHLFGCMPSTGRYDHTLRDVRLLFSHIEGIRDGSPEFATSAFGAGDWNPVPSLDLLSGVSIAVT